MKKFGYLIVFLIFILIFITFRQQYILSASEQNIAIDSTLLAEPKKEPLEIAELIQEYDSLVSTEIKSSGTVGAAVVITYKNQVALLKCYGVKKAGEKDSINENTIFRLASVSKTLSGILAGILVNEKVINLDDKVINYLPDFKLKNTESTNNLTIRNLLSHTSGLVPHAYDNLVEEKVPIEKIITDLSLVDISAPPGQLYGYQNVMFSLFDTILTTKTHKTYDEIITENLFQPFGMENASTGFETFKTSNNKAFPHAGANGNFRTLRLNDRYYNTAPAAGINASISDMAGFLLNLSGDENSVINNKILNTVFTPQILSPLKRTYLSRWDRVDSKHYALGWRIIGYKGRKVAYHGGFVQGYKTEIAFCEEENIGIAYLTNSPNPVASKTVPTLLNLMFKFSDDKKILSENESLDKQNNGS